MRLGDFDALKETIINFCGRCSNNITEYDENNVPNGNCAIWHILNMIDNAPTVEINTNDIEYKAYCKGLEDGKKIARPQGEWIIIDDTVCECPQCKHQQTFLLSPKESNVNFCENCGAKMTNE